MAGLFQPFDPFDEEGGDRPRRARLLRRRIRPIPFRVIAPNLVTIMALCSGLTAIRMAIESHYDFAILAIFIAAILDGLDGRVARMLKGTSRFGAELDSLTDFVNFGVTPAVVLYVWKLQQVRSMGWIAVLVFAIAMALRLARFNTMLASDVKKPEYQANFFTGVPAPAGALLVMLPLYFSQMGVEIPVTFIPALALYVVAVGMLLVSRLPTFSGKKLGLRIRRDMVLPLFVVFVVAVGLFVSYTYEMLALVTLVYLFMLPLGWRAYNRLRAEYEATHEAGQDAHLPDDNVPPEERAYPSEDRPSLH